MGRYIEATARKHFLCAWKCCSCSHMNIEEPQASMFARETISVFHKEDEAREKARQRANEYLQTYLSAIPETVNVKLNFNSLEKCGTCSQCGAQQPWAKKPKYSLILVIIVIAAAVAAAIPLAAFIPFVIFGALLGIIGAIALGEFLAIRSRRRAAQEINDELCRPLAITNSIPDNIRRDDPRLRAMLTYFAEKKKPAG